MNRKATYIKLCLFSGCVSSRVYSHFAVLSLFVIISKIKKIQNTYAACNGGHSILVNRRMYHFYIDHVQHNVDHTAIDRIDFQHSQDYNDIFRFHKFHLVHSPSYKRLQKRMSKNNNKRIETDITRSREKKPERIIHKHQAHNINKYIYFYIEYKN